MVVGQSGAFHRDDFDLVAQRGRQAVGDRRARGKRLGEILAIELVVERHVLGVAHVVARLDDVPRSLPAASSTLRKFSIERRNSPSNVPQTIFPLASTEAWPETKIKSPTTTAGLNGKCDVGVSALRG